MRRSEADWIERSVARHRQRSYVLCGLSRALEMHVKRWARWATGWSLEASMHPTLKSRRQLFLRTDQHFLFPCCQVPLLQSWIYPLLPHTLAPSEYSFPA